MLHGALTVRPALQRFSDAGASVPLGGVIRSPVDLGPNFARCDGRTITPGAAFPYRNADIGPWTSLGAQGQGRAIYGLAYNPANGVWMALPQDAGSGSIRARRSTNNGGTWTDCANFDSVPLPTIAGRTSSWGGWTDLEVIDGYFVAIGYWQTNDSEGSYSHPRIARSVDGLSWQILHATTQAFAPQQIVFGNGMYMAIMNGYSSFALKIPADFSTITTFGLSESNNWASVVFFNGQFHFSGPGKVRSTDGVAATVVSVAGSHPGLAYIRKTASGLFVGFAGTTVYWSRNPLATTPNWRTSPALSGAPQDIAEGAGMLIVSSSQNGYGQATNVKSLSVDDPVFTLMIDGAAGNISTYMRAAFGNNRFMMACADGEIVKADVVYGSTFTVPVVPAGVRQSDGSSLDSYMRIA